MYPCLEKASRWGKGDGSSLIVYFISGILSELLLKVEVLTVYAHKKMKFWSPCSTLAPIPSGVHPTTGEIFYNIFIRSYDLSLKTHCTSSPYSLLWLIILCSLLVLLISPPVHYNPATLAFFLFLQYTSHVCSSGPQHIFPFACNTHIFTWLAPCHSDLCPRSLSRRKRSCHVMSWSCQYIQRSLAWLP